MNLFIKILNNNLYKIIELILLSLIVPYIVLILKVYINHTLTKYRNKINAITSR
jgi:hypothetical protein